MSPELCGRCMNWEGDEAGRISVSQIMRNRCPGLRSLGFIPRAVGVLSLLGEGDNSIIFIV